MFERDIKHRRCWEEQKSFGFGSPVVNIKLAASEKFIRIQTLAYRPWDKGAEDKMSHAF